MNVNYFQLIMSVIRDFRVIVTLVAALVIIEFAKFITAYRKKPARPKKVKAPKQAPAPAPKPEAAEGGEGGGEGAEG